MGPILVRPLPRPRHGTYLAAARLVCGALPCSFFGACFLPPACLTGAFFTGLFFTGAFFTGAFLDGGFFAGAFSAVILVRTVTELFAGFRSVVDDVTREPYFSTRPARTFPAGSTLK